MNYKNILIFRIGHLGDTLVSLPAFWAIKKAFPRAKLTLLSSSTPHQPNYVSARNVLPEKGLFDDWITYPAAGAGKLNFLKNTAYLLFELRRRRFDAAFYLMTRNRLPAQLRRDKLFFRAAGIPHLIGTRLFEREMLDYTRPRPLPRIETELEFFLKSLEYEKVPIPPRAKLRPDLLLTDEEKEFADRWLFENCGYENGNKVLIAVSPASKWPSKVWPEERFAEVFKELIDRKNIFPIVFGGPEDREKGKRLLKHWRIGANACGELNIRQAAAALRVCRLLIGNDSGTMHLAASVGVQCLGIFSALDWLGRWEPFGENNVIFRAQIECEGCLLEFCPRGNECLDRIEAETVLQAGLKALRN